MNVKYNAVSLDETTDISVSEITETVETVGVETFPPENDQVENMIHTIPMMGKGMLGIFIVTVIIIVSVAILNKVTNIKKDN